MKTVKYLKRKHRDRMWFGRSGELWFYEVGMGWAVVSGAAGFRVYYNCLPDANEGPFTEAKRQAVE